MALSRMMMMPLQIGFSTVCTVICDPRLMLDRGKPQKDLVAEHSLLSYIPRGRVVLTGRMTHRGDVVSVHIML